LKDLRGYYSHIAVLDECVRQLRDAVNQSGSAEDTIFVFTSDHGDMLQSQGLPRKQFPWDESIRVPFLVSYPRALSRRKRKLLTPIDAPDIMPTLLSLAGIRVPESVQGADYSDLVRGRTKEAAEPAALLNLPASFSVIRRHGFAEYRGVRTPRYTYVRSIHGPWLFYDNQLDPYQKRNLACLDKYRDLQAKLERMLDKKLKAAGDEFLPGARYIERANAGHYREVNADVARVKSPWGDWESTWR
jgi:arylsulfatase A-like enzyme